MDITIHPQKLNGTIPAIPSKSQAHRLLICAAFADKETTLICPQTNRDIDATVDCLNALGAEITATESGFHIKPIQEVPAKAQLNCCESGSTLRFLLPIVGALGVDATFLMEGRLPRRPLSPLWELMEEKGCQLSRPTENTLRCQGKLNCGEFTIDGGISSQFITGLLFAATLLTEQSAIRITGKLQSKPYVDMTLKALEQFYVVIKDLTVETKPVFRSPGSVIVEGDWSNAAFFLGANALRNCVSVTNLRDDSAQGDRAAADLIPKLKDYCSIDCSDIPDLVPILAVVAAGNAGAEFTHISRLRLKESDRVASTIAMLTSLGCKAEATRDVLTVLPGNYTGGTVDSAGDHRIAMAAAIAATVAAGPVTILGADAVNKSYPNFWADYRRLGGNYELNVR